MAMLSVCSGLQLCIFLNKDTVKCLTVIDVRKLYVYGSDSGRKIEVDLFCLKRVRDADYLNDLRLNC